jgi:hypothetical protein
MKGAVTIDGIGACALADYAGICGLLLEGHARTSAASMIAGYLGRSDKVDRALSIRPRLRRPNRARLPGPSGRRRPRRLHAEAVQ